MASQTDRPAVFSGLQEGALVLADICGYSAFVQQTEVDHSWSILHELLDTAVRSVEGRMDVSQVEGDAILFITGLSTPDVIKALEGTFVAFHRRPRDMQAVTTCPCNACARISVLKLKFVVHHGKFSRQRLGNVEQLHGADVIVPHRLLKNKVPSKEYLLVTDAVLERLPDEARAESIYKRLLEPKVMERYLISDDVEAVAGARGEDLGAEFHCHHGGSVVSMRVVNLEPGRELTLIADQPTTMYITTRLSEEGEGRTKVARSFLWEEPQDPDVAQSLRQVMEFTAAAGEAAIRSAFEQRA